MFSFLKSTLESHAQLRAILHYLQAVIVINVFFALVIQQTDETVSLTKSAFNLHVFEL